MKSFSRTGKLAIALTGFALAGTALAGALLAATATVTIRSGNLIVHAAGEISPRALPKNRMVPIVLHARGAVETADGTHAPAARTLVLHVDKHIGVESEGLAACSLGRLEARSPAQAMGACGAALVGKGEVSAQVLFPESVPFGAKGPLLVFNGPPGADGPAYPHMFFYTYVSVPVPTAVIAPATLAKGSGRYGFTISVTIPTVAGGSGSLTSFEMTVDRHWQHDGRRLGYLNAECPDGHFLDRVEASFVGGTELNGMVGNSCKPLG